jgi:dextranase
MKIRFASLIFLMLLLTSHLEGSVMSAVETGIQIRFKKSFFHPGDTIEFTVESSAGSQLNAYVMYLDKEIATINAPIINGQAKVDWTPPPFSPRGYGLIVNVLNDSGQLIATKSSAFDVLEHWTNAPRYGFLTDFSAGRDNDQETINWIVKHHVNGIQFYDWQYRWENLVPDTDIFADGLGRPQSMLVIRRLIDLLHAHNVSAMPYTAIYGASMAYFRQHPDWALLDAKGAPYLFGGDLIGIMNPAVGSAWNDHLMTEFADVLDHTTLDGIHIDQYGSPKIGFDKDGNRIDLAEVMPQFINQTAEIVRSKRGDDGTTLFNCVGNWPIKAVASSQQNASYIEVWPPHNDYIDLNRIIDNAQKLGNEKSVILAAYIPPERTINWRLANAVIYASGGFHLETGEPQSMLADPYFPKYGKISEADQDLFGRYYDFLVRYENVLSIQTHSGSSERAHAVNLDNVRTRGISAKDRVVPIVRIGAGYETFNLINFVGIDESNWNAPTNISPTPFTDLAVIIQVTRPVSQVWVASPDNETSMNATSLPFTVENDSLKIQLPHLNYWNMIVVEYADAN